ncbi:sigma-70 family RNA polymerase sigma factor, partial [Streptomyces triticagri]
RTAPAWTGAADPAGGADQERRRELARLAWPEAAGTTPEQREALELAVRHGLSTREVASVLGMEQVTARELLSAAACEVERTRAALAVVEKGTCPSVARLTGDNQLLLGTALRAELVRHVDDCPRCRRTAERAGAAAWPGTTPTAAALPVVRAPRAAAHAAMGRAAHARGGAPRFDRRGFPMDPKDRAARRDRLRARAVTTTVVATVVAAPVLALWAAYRGAPLVGEGRDGSSVSASESDGTGLGADDARDYENAGNARTDPDPRFTAGSRSPDVSVEVISPGADPSHSRVGPGRLTVAAQPSGGATVVTLTASGGEPVHWSASTRAYWLHLTRTSGTLMPGESVSFRVYVDHHREPAGHWSARIAVGPGNSVVAIDGYGATSPSPSNPDRPTPTRPPSTPPPSSPDPDPTSQDPTTPPPSDPPPSSPDPDPTDSSPDPSEPEPSDPPSSDPGGTGPTG